MRKILLMILAGTACLLNSCGQKVSNVLPITVFPDSIISDVSNHPVGVNLNFLMDGGRFPEAETNVAGAVKKLGTKYLRCPGGEKSDFYFFSVSPMKHHILRCAELPVWIIIPVCLKMGTLFMIHWILMNLYIYAGK